MASLLRDGGTRGGRLPTTIHRAMRSRLKKALEATDPLASLSAMPGPQGLRQAVAAARSAGVAGESEASALQAVEVQIDRFEKFLEQEQMSLQTLAAALGDFVPDLTTPALDASAQAVFKGMSHLIGHYAEARLVLNILMPGSTEGSLSFASIRGCQAWRRLRMKSSFVVYGVTELVADAYASTRRTSLDGRPLHQFPGGLAILEEFGSTPSPRFVPDGASQSFYRLEDTGIGIRSDSSFFFGEVIHDAGARYRTIEEDVMMLTAGIAMPCRTLVFDVLIHRDLMPEACVTLETYNTVPRGSACAMREADIAARASDRIDVGASMKVLGQGLPNLDSLVIDRYGEMVEYAIKQAGYERSDFRGYRCEQSYPVYGCEYAFRLPLPPRGESAGPA